jgi:hypothetical protein
VLQQQPVVVTQKLIVSVACFLASVWSLFCIAKRLGRARLPALMKNRDVVLVIDFVRATLRCCCCLLWATSLQRWGRERGAHIHTMRIGFGVTLIVCGRFMANLWRNNKSRSMMLWGCGMCVCVQVEVGGERVEQQQQ